jgi:hypothetical protein
MKLWWLDVFDATDPDVDGDGAPSTSGTSSLSLPSPSSGDVRATEPSSPPFWPTRALVAVACADGPPSAHERRAVADVVDVAPDIVWRVYRPREVGLPPDGLTARRTLERMALVALVDRDDGVVDDSERMVLRSFARAWGIDDDDLCRRIDAVAVDVAPRDPWTRWVTRLGIRRRRRPASSSSSSFSVLARIPEVR